MRAQDNHLIRVFIVSDSHIMRSGLRRIIESHTGIHILGDVGLDKASTAETVLRHRPELVLLDLDSRDHDIAGLIATLQKTFKDSAILVLSDLADHELIRKALALGAAGVVLKIQPPAVLIAAIQDLCPSSRVYQPLPYSPDTDMKHTKGHEFLKTYTPYTKDTPKIDSLTTREREIIRLVCLGLKNKDIAKQLSISDITVRHHLTSIFCKLEVADRQKLLILAHRYGLAELTLSESA